MANTIRLIGVGGAGVTIGNEVGGMLSDLGEGFSNVVRHYVDTSTNNITDDMRDEGLFHLIESKNLTKAKIMGSGSERRTHAGDINESVKDYLDKNKILNNKTDMFNVVVFSGSGGTGSVGGPLIVKNLLEANIPVVVVMVGDSTNGLSGLNTISTIATLHKFTMAHKKALPIMYVNNEAYMSNGVSNAIADANKSIFNSLSALSLFLSGDNESIDSQDMINIIDQTNYKTINVKPGLYALSTFSKNVVLPEGCIPTVTRTLTTRGVSPDLNIVPAHSKSGTILADNAANIYREHAPIHMVAYANFFKIEEQRLRAFTDKIQAAMAAIETEDIGSHSQSEVDDDTGLIF